MVKALCDEIRWPTPQQFEAYRQQFLGFQSLSTFNEAFCVVDGTEVRISRPTKEPQQKQVYSKKKKQHALNVLFITLLNGEIIYFSSVYPKPHDQ